jgi:hypothetical protein
MLSLDSHDLFRYYAQRSNQFGLLLSFSWELTDDGTNLAELFEAAPILKTIWDDCPQIINDGIGYFFFDTEEELNKAYDNVVGDDGPTESNPYNGPARVYALTCDNLGNFCSENT